MIEVTELSIAQLRAALESGRTTAVELVTAYLARIAAYDGPATETRLNAVVVPNPKPSARPKPPMHAAPVVKHWARWTAFPTPPRTAIW
jgi:Asp-tRNA(Asn)/Glu-tRNA(Gln) amidotransferase A subunit family amidase